MDKQRSDGRQLKIAVFHNLPSGGGKRRLYELIKRLAADHEVDLYNLATDCEAYLDVRPLVRHTFTSNLWVNLQDGRAFSIFNPALKFLQIGELVLAEAKMARRINSCDYDVVFVNSCMFTQTPPILRHLGKPAVYHCDEPLRRFYEPKSPRPYDRGLRAWAKKILYLPTDVLIKRMERTSMGFATVVCANSYYSREAMYRIFGSFPRVVRLGVDTEVFRRVEPREEGLVVSVGRIAPHKAYDFLLRSVAAVEPRPRLIIACDAAEALELDYIRRLAASLSLDVEVRQRVSESELIGLYSRASVAALTAILEPLGLSALEAMACETPVVAVQEGGFRETIVHGETGFLADRTVESFAKHIHALLSDASLVEDLGLKAREHVKANWSWDPSAKALERIILEVASTCNRQR